jgi:hypothetical protein
LVDRLEALLNKGWRVPLSAKTMIDEDEFLDIVDQMRIAFPEEIKQAKKIVQERERIITQAQEEAKNIVETADIQYDELVKLAQNTLLSFLYLNENFQFYPFLKSNYLIIQLEKYSFLWSQIDENGHSFYIIVFKDGANFNDLLKMDVQSVAKTLIKLIKKG